MKITLNKRLTEIDAETLSIAELLGQQKFSFKMLIVKLNGVIVKKESHSETFVRDGDHVDVIHLMSGG